MTTKREENEIVRFLLEQKRNMDTVLYACTSAYPVPAEDVCLYEILRLRKKFGKKVKAIGFSGHHKGIAMDIAATTLGAEFIERHFTLDRTFKGTDHPASLEPDGLRRVARDLEALSKALKYKSKEILDVEYIQRKKLKWNRNYLNGN
jgi:N-acetylneuraminate synthase